MNFIRLLVLNIVFIIIIAILGYLIGRWVRQQRIYQKGYDSEDMILDLLYEWADMNNISANI